MNIKNILVFGVGALGLVSGLTQAGKITSGPSASEAPNAPEFVAEGFGGWNLDNVKIILNESNLDDGDNSSFEPSDGSYYFSPDADFTYQGNVGDGFGPIMGYVLAKDWPVGEPSGIKIVNDDLLVKEPKPQNCIMATSYLEDHFLDSTDPQQVLCSGPFQSHKRYKLAMLPSTVVDGAGLEKGIDLVFNVEADGGSRDYQVFQKINNWTDGRLEGFTIQVGFGIGNDFVLASEAEGVGVANLSLSVPAAIWTPNQLANFSAGLFGPADPKHDRPPGFYDMTTGAGFEIVEYPNLSAQTDTLTSGATLGSDYAEVPAGASNQFGPWLPNTMLPSGVFWDDDGNPETDAQLLAWYGWNPNLTTPALGWMAGAADGFAEVPAATITGWGENLEFTQDVIDDLVNVGLNYVVTIGDVTSFTGNTFTIRITPKTESGVTPPPPYVVDGETVTPVPSLEFVSSDGVVAVSPEPEFVKGSLLTARVGDADLNLDPEAIDEVDVTISATGLSDEVITLFEQGENRGVFAATLPEAFSNVPVDTVVTVTYTDVIDGSDLDKHAETIATDEILPPPPAAIISIDNFTAPASLFVGQTGKLSVTVLNAKDSEATVSGTVIIAANGVEIYSEGFTDLSPNKKDRISTRWTAPDETDVLWTATVIIDSEVVAENTAFTTVSVKPDKSNNNGNNK
ncbi:MAG: choice-of-anchor F family protein [Gammaproteobacteria bacterium]|nr:choice-of-anchor F family protein [Gammaproteobacteria bacterium]MBQ0840623.1 choice-of-anchor F family protein [Gammaproteobacteria bacterium]